MRRREEEAEEVVRENASVVGQDKGNESLWIATRVFLRLFRYFFANHHDSCEVTGNRTPGVTGGRAFQNGSQERGTRTGRGFLALSALIAGAALLSLGGRLFNLRITLTDSSAAAGIYRLIAVPAGRGMLVAACLPAASARAGLARGYLGGGDCPAGAEPVAKVIGALPGDVVEVEGSWAAVNGVRFANSRTAARDSAGRPLAHVAWGVHRVGAGEVWLFGFNNARSWDARYFGAVPLAGVRGVLRPVLTW